MARKTTRKPKAARPQADVTDRLVDAALALAAEDAWEEVTLDAVAARAGVPLAELLVRFAGKQELLAAFMRRIDRRVIAGLDPDLAGEPARERLLDVLLARLEVLEPYRAAVRSIATAAARAPDLALALNREAVVSQRAMLAAAGIGNDGVAGLVRAQGLAAIFARTLRVWLDDDDPGMARTMAELDRRLRDGERLLRGMGRATSFLRLGREICGALAGRRASSRAGAPPPNGNGSAGDRGQAGHGR